MIYINYSTSSSSELSLQKRLVERCQARMFHLCAIGTLLSMADTEHTDTSEVNLMLQHIGGLINSISGDGLGDIETLGGIISELEELTNKENVEFSKEAAIVYFSKKFPDTRTCVVYFDEVYKGKHKIALNSLKDKLSKRSKNN